MIDSHILPPKAFPVNSDFYRICNLYHFFVNFSLFLPNIKPLIERLDSAKTQALKKQICEQYGLSDRTLRRYLAKYREEGFGGLRPKSKGRQESSNIAPEVMEQAILLRREVPGRSVAQIIQILEWESRIQPGEIKRSTLQERLASRGYSTRHMRIYAESGVAARRFQQRHRNRL
ncbi:helix-turn-helix domain-containing protein [Cohnella faecalis]|uniref:helix-turn-helix domain-containing protein n=1 Tax=Cohnella faecalis TaxID=2315694 RepID=UPI0018F6D4EA|nr:helix-turn-helix domain-containing protein [Cohnella faecalis]